MTHQDTPPSDQPTPRKISGVKNTYAASAATGGVAVVAIWAAAGFHWPPPDPVILTVVTGLAPAAHLIWIGIQNRLQKWAEV